MQHKVQRIVKSEQLGIFTNGYWGHPQMHLQPELELMLFSHYLQAFEFQRKASQIVAMLGGKTPHIQNLTVGGVANALDLDGETGLGMGCLESIRVLASEVSGFIHQVYFPDACMLAGYYSEWFDIGKGSDTYLSVPDLPREISASQFDLPGGYIGRVSADSSSNAAPYSDHQFRNSVTEDVVHAYYRGDKALHPWKGETIPELTAWEPEKK